MDFIPGRLNLGNKMGFEVELRRIVFQIIQSSFILYYVSKPPKVLRDSKAAVLARE